MLCHRDANEILTLCIQIQCIHGESQFSAPTVVIKRMLPNSVDPTGDATDDSILYGCVWIGQTKLFLTYTIFFFFKYCNVEMGGYTILTEDD